MFGKRYEEYNEILGIRENVLNFNQIGGRFGWAELERNRISSFHVKMAFFLDSKTSR